MRPVAVCCMEMQRGVVGDLSTVPVTRRAVEESGLVEAIARLLQGARRAGVPVVHCTASFRPDRVGSFANMPMVEALRSGGTHLEVGSPSTEVVPALWTPSDLVSERHHGIAPFTGTGLEPLLRSMGVERVVAVGVSLNRGITGLAIEAVNRGFHVTIPDDAVVGYPADYGKAVLEHTLTGIATITTVDGLLAEWAAAEPRSQTSA